MILWNILAKAFLPVAILFLSIASTNCKMSVASCKQWQESLDCPNSGLRRLSLFQLTVQIRAWGLMHCEQCEEKDVLRQIQLQVEVSFCFRESVASSDPRSAPQTAKKTFFLKSHLTRWHLSLGRDSHLSELILLDTSRHRAWVDIESLLLLDAGAQQVVGAGIGTETLCIIVIMVRGNLTSSLQKPQLAGPSPALLLVPGRDWALEFRAERTNSLRLNSAEDFYCQPLTSQLGAL